MSTWSFTNDFERINVNLVVHQRLRENQCQLGRSPTTQSQWTAAVTDMVECLAAAKLAATVAELGAGIQSFISC